VPPLTAVNNQLCVTDRACVTQSELEFAVLLKSVRGLQLGTIYYMRSHGALCNLKEKRFQVFNYESRQEDVWGIGGIAPSIFNLSSECRRPTGAPQNSIFLRRVTIGHPTQKRRVFYGTRTFVTIFPIHTK